MTKTDRLRTQSGAPPWAISLGLGTPEESAARRTQIKWAVRVLWAAVLSLIILGYAMVSDRGSVSSRLFVIVVLTSALTVMACAAGTHFAIRQRSRART